MAKGGSASRAPRCSGSGRPTGLKPHRLKAFKLSRDPAFAAKLRDVVGLYLDPPEHALVLCVDEKSQIQALDRTQKSLPIYPGRLGTMTHDYKRNGTTTLFAAAPGHVGGTLIGRACPASASGIHHVPQADRRRDVAADLDLHLIVDNYATHKHPKVNAWLKRHKRFHFHFIPTSSSWLNLVETLVPRDHR